MSHKIFESIGLSKPKKSAFDLSFEKKLSFNMGDLIPMYLEEVMPGDHFKVDPNIMLRLAPMISPVMHRVDVRTEYFFVPTRIIWDEWSDFITGGDDGNAAPVMPVSTFTNASGEVIETGSLADHLGVPTVEDSTTIVEPMVVSQLPFRAYAEIYNEYYRDENLQTKLDLNTGDILFVRKRAWEKDYFTSALPFAQKGPAVNVPITGNVLYNDDTILTRDDGITPAAPNSPLDTSAGPNPVVLQDSVGDVVLKNIKSLEGNMNIEDLRSSSALQRWLEKSAQGGSRLKEMIMAQFGQKTSDARLQRPEYLGGSKGPVVISEVLNTTGVAGQNPQGDMAGHGLSISSKGGFSKQFEEHGYVIGIISVLPRTAYQQGLERLWTRFDKFKYPWPEFANLGEQEVLNSEIYQDFLTAGGVPNTETFGYQQRFAEYKYNCDKVSGDFKTNLDFWHMGRIFSQLPVLDGPFIESDPTNRIFAVDNPDADHLWCQIYQSVKARRPLPYFAKPSLR